jgi:hypothetical protein
MIDPIYIETHSSSQLDWFFLYALEYTIF